MKKSILMDCDPGHDDAIALLMAFACDRLEVKAVTTVGGNQTSDKTLMNALRVLSFAGITHVPVAAGASRPLVRELEIAPEVHGETGLDGPELPDPVFQPSSVSALELMEQVITESEKPVTLVPTGPLTNIASLLIAAPHVKPKIQRISLMGGAAVGGNWTPAAEFNIMVDPEAADIVFRSGIPITMCGLDVTHKALIYDDEIEKLRQQGGKAAVMVAELLDFFSQSHKDAGFSGCPLHDLCAIAWLIDPTIFSSTHLRVDIETAGELTDGATVVDIRGITGRSPNVDVVFDVDRERLIQLLYDSMNYYRQREVLS